MLTSFQNRSIAAINQATKCLGKPASPFDLTKLRSKGRFQSVSHLGKWAAKMIEVFAAPEANAASSILTKLREVLPGFQGLKHFLQRFAATTDGVARMMEILKNKGLNQDTFEQCRTLVEGLSRHISNQTPVALISRSTARPYNFQRNCGHEHCAEDMFRFMESQRHHQIPVRELQTHSRTQSSSRHEPLNPSHACALP